MVKATAFDLPPELVHLGQRAFDRRASLSLRTGTNPNCLMTRAMNSPSRLWLVMTAGC